MTIVDPAMSNFDVHFTGRSGARVPEAGAAISMPDSRLWSILTTGRIAARTVPYSGGSPVVSVSDLSWAELTAAFSHGLNSRGPLPPWALILDRSLMWAAGMRPVVYADSGDAAALEVACEAQRGPGWGALVMPVTLDGPGRNDWLHEREWRICYPPEGSWCLDVRSAARAVVVGDHAWNPPHMEAQIRQPVARWLWAGGALTLTGVLQPTNGYWAAPL